MTKNQAISLKLAQWLGYTRAAIYPNALCAGQFIVLINPVVGWEHFNPFASTTEGCAQFAECAIKALQHFAMRFTPTDMLVSVWVECSAQKRWRWIHVHHSVGDAELRRATLEAIYYAIDGKADAWEAEAE